MKKILLYTIYILTIICATSTPAAAFRADTYAGQSVLASGQWVRVAVTSTGMHRITAADIRKWGFSNIENIRIFGYGGEMIPDLLSADNYTDDLPQVPVVKQGNSLLFYAKGTVKITSATNSAMVLKQTQHPYATEGYYFITENSEIPQAMFTETEGIQTSEMATTFHDITFHEQELINPGHTGRKLYGEDFKYNSSQSFKFKLTDNAGTDEVKVLTAFAVKSTQPSILTMSSNGTQLAQSPSDRIKAVNDPVYDHLVLTNSAKSAPIDGEDLTWGIKLTTSGVTYNAFLDYITVNYTRHLRLKNGNLNFRLPKTSGGTIGGASQETVLLDVTDTTPKKVKTTFSDGNLSFLPIQYGERSYAAFNPSANFPAPKIKETVANQNLHAEDTPDLVIITPPEFRAQAQRIAQLHADNDTMRTLVVTPQTIYNEFSSGTPDINAYRRLCKMFYDRGSDNGHSMRYLLLFGRAHYDNRLLSNAAKLNAKYPTLLTWQTEQSESESTSYNTDDIIGFLEDNSGRTPGTDKLSIAIGRMPVKNITEAKEMVDKLYRYVNASKHSNWKNNILIIADDEDGAVHMSQSETVISNMKSYGGNAYNFNRVYTDAYIAESGGAGRFYPDAREQMFRHFSNGALWVNYIGHANPVSWTHDGLLSITDINNKFYYNNYPLLYTATCEFTRWDDDEVSGGELMFLNNRGGVIGLISTSRVAYISENGTLNTLVAKYAFARDINGHHLRLGDILRNAKNDYPSANENKLRYSITGDPAMRLVYPQHNVVLETINGIAVDGDNYPEIKAASTAEITGYITDNNGSRLDTFNGTLSATLFDAEQSVTTHGYGKNGKEYTFNQRSNTLYSGQDSIRNGQFKLTVLMPKEISDNYSPAMFNFYACDENGIEANGANEKFYAYGYSEDTAGDTKGPEIKYCYLNGESFADGQAVNESPMLFAAFSDTSGINISSAGIGHRMSATIDGKKQYTNLSEFYTPTTGDPHSGTLVYPLSKLTPGEHSLKFKVWDNLGNSSDTTLTFTVIEGLTPELYEVYTPSSPAKTEANFYLKHNRPDAMVTVTIEVFNLMGRPVWSSTQTGKSDLFLSFPITWNLCDNAGRRVNRGIYLYRATISTDGTHAATKSKKLAVAAEQ